MTISEQKKELILDLYENVLRREPSTIELSHWVNALNSGHKTIEDLIRTIFDSGEFKRKKGVKSDFPAGHFHSPVVDPKTIEDYVQREWATKSEEIAGIPINIQSMREIWVKNLSFTQSCPFTDEPNKKNRYNYLGGPFPHGDALTLRMMLSNLMPKRIVEIGSGYSTACMLDSADHLGLSDLKLTCVEPYPDRLKSLLRPTDSDRVTLIQDYVQSVPINILTDLDEGDILFIDSTHVVKTGSDVHFEFFHILPRLRSGVIVHFHDIIYPFEYPRKWIFERNYSWNEAYVLRAFLMHNSLYEIIFWPSLFARVFRAELNRELPVFLRNPGSSIWLRKTG